MKISMIGCGTLGGAFARCFLDKGLCSREELELIEKRDERAKELCDLFGCTVKPAADVKLGSSDLVMIAVRPQEFAAAAGEFSRYLGKEQGVLSVMAGVTIAAVKERLNGHTQVVRAMPNLPVKIGRGITAFCASDGVSSGNLDAVRELLEATGKCLELKEEKQLDAVTAISGSGPGYLFYLIEHLERAALKIGFSMEEAGVLIGETVAGALEVWERDSASAAELKESMRLKGGTTEAAYRVLEENRAGEIFIEAVDAAYARALDLGKKNDLN